MELFIQIRDGKPHEHPIMGDNFRSAFPDIDPDNLPPEFARFERVPAPNLGHYEVNEGLTYEWVDGIVKDVWHIRPMTEQERATKEQELISAAMAFVAYMKDDTSKKIAAATSDAERQSWEEYLAALNAWTLVDPTNPQVPPPPGFDTGAPGSAPDVTG